MGISHHSPTIIGPIGPFRFFWAGLSCWLLQVLAGRWWLAATISPLTSTHHSPLTPESQTKLSHNTFLPTSTCICRPVHSSSSHSATNHSNSSHTLFFLLVSFFWSTTTTSCLTNPLPTLNQLPSLISLISLIRLIEIPICLSFSFHSSVSLYLNSIPSHRNGFLRFAFSPLLLSVRAQRRHASLFTHDDDYNPS